MEAIKQRLLTVKEAFQKVGNWIAEKYRNNKKKCRGTLLALAVLMLLAGLIVGSFKYVDSLSQGSPINYTSGTIIDSTIANGGSFLGLNTYYKTVPKVNFLISFQITKENNKYSFPPIRTRVQEGTLLEIELYAKVQLVPSSLKSFLENYGFEQVEGHEGWLVYIKEKIKNVAVQQVALFRFYQISNKALSTAINTQFQTYESTISTFPFVVRIISINIHYPGDSLRSKDTLGVRLLEQQSLLNQLTTQLSQIQGYIKDYNTQTVSYAQKRGQIEGQMISREKSVKLSSIYWSEGINSFSNAVNQNSTLLQKYLQIYFNSIYNATYRIQSLQPFQI